MSRLRLEPTIDCTHPRFVEGPNRPDTHARFGGVMGTVGGSPRWVRCLDCGLTVWPEADVQAGPGASEPTRQRAAAEREPGRPIGSGRVIPDADWIRNGYRATCQKLGKLRVTMQEAADDLIDARTGERGVPIRTYQDAVRREGTGFPPM